MELQSGTDLQSFFDEWVYGTALPVLATSWDAEMGVLRWELENDSPWIAQSPVLLEIEQEGRRSYVLLRNGEQVLLTLVIPVLVLLGFTTLPIVDLGSGPRVDFLAPGVLALAVMSTAFTGLAIGTGFERRYGVLKRLGATPLPRIGLLAAKVLAVLAVQAVQIVLLCTVALLLGWSPQAGVAGWAVAVLLVLGATAAFGSFALLMAGTLRAEATLAAANLVFLLLLGLGGVAVPVDLLPGPLAAAAALLPITALSEGLRTALAGGAPPVGALVILACWAVAGMGRPVRRSMIEAQSPRAQTRFSPGMAKVASGWIQPRLSVAPARPARTGFGALPTVLMTVAVGMRLPSSSSTRSASTRVRRRPSTSWTPAWASFFVA
jgi:ABC-2 type transport system permease protein